MARKPQQLSLWNSLPDVSEWDDVRLPDEYHAFYKKHHKCLNCRQKLRHPLHALNHYRKFHLKSRLKFFVWKFGMWLEVSQRGYLRAKQLRVPTARTKK